MQASTHAQYQQQLNANKLPLAIRVYGVLLLLDALVSIPTFVLLGLDTVRSLYANPITHTPTLTSILAYTDGVLQFGIMTALVALGISILRNRRIRVARYAYAIMPFTVAQGLIDLALYGVNAHQLSALLQMVILIAVSVTADPSLFDERQLQRKLKSMNARDVYEEALRINMVGRDLSGKGYIELNFFNLFWVFLVSSVIGLGIETVYHFILFGEYQDRAGLLFGPFSPIYGFGGVLLGVFDPEDLRGDAVVAQGQGERASDETQTGNQCFHIPILFIKETTDCRPAGLRRSRFLSGRCASGVSRSARGVPARGAACTLRAARRPSGADWPR